jgi:uncharacterized protein
VREDVFRELLRRGHSAAAHQRTGNDLAAALWDGCDAALSSRLAYPEVRAALATAICNHDLTGPELASALAIGDPELIIAVWDRHLHAAAQAAGCRVAPAQLDHIEPRRVHPNKTALSCADQHCADIHVLAALRRLDLNGAVAAVQVKAAVSTRGGRQGAVGYR